MHADIQEEIEDRIDLAEDGGNQLSVDDAIFDLLEAIDLGFRPKSLRRHAHKALIEIGSVVDITDAVNAGEIFVSRGKPYLFKLDGRLWGSAD